MSVFRVEKIKDYTVMSNFHLRDKAISLKAKGLLSLMLSLPDDWDYSLKGLVAISVEGIDAIRQAVLELENSGYIVRVRTRNERGHIIGSDYVIYERPHCENPNSPDSTSPASSATSKEQVAEEPALETPTLDLPTLENPTLDNPMLDNPMLEKPTSDNPIQSNTNVSNTYPINKRAAGNPYPYQSYPSYQPTVQDRIPAGMRDRMGWDERGFAAAAEYQEIIRQQIAYDILLGDPNTDKGRLDEIVSVMVETLSTTSDTISVAGGVYPTDLVRERIRKLNSQHIQYVFHCLDKTTSRIKNIKKYLLAVLYNAASTMNSYYAALVNHNHGSADISDSWSIA